MIVSGSTLLPARRMCIARPAVTITALPFHVCYVCMGVHMYHVCNHATNLYKLDTIGRNECYVSTIAVSLRLATLLTGSTGVSYCLVLPWRMYSKVTEMHTSSHLNVADNKN